MTFICSGFYLLGAGAHLNFMIIGFCLGVCSGFAIPVAQKFGEKNDSALRRFVANSGWLAAIFSVVMTSAVCVLCRIFCCGWTLRRILSTGPTAIFL